MPLTKITCICQGSKIKVINKMYVKFPGQYITGNVMKTGNLIFKKSNKLVVKANIAGELTKWLSILLRKLMEAEQFLKRK